MGAPCLPLYRVCDATNDCIYGTDESISVCGRVRYEKSGETALWKKTNNDLSLLFMKSLVVQEDQEAEAVVLIPVSEPK